VAEAAETTIELLKGREAKKQKASKTIVDKKERRQTARDDKNMKALAKYHADREAIA
jgi:hypothetical protein